MINHPDFNSYQEAVDYFEHRVNRQRKVVAEESAKLRELEDSLKHNRSELFKEMEGSVKC